MNTQNTITITEININETVSTFTDFVLANEIQDAQNIAKSRVFYYKSLGWLQFSTDELLAEAYVGISEAIVRFNPSKGTVKKTKFTSYAYFWINKKIQEYIAKNKSMLSGNLSECWNGKVPYTSSYDAFAETEDSAGIDSIVALSNPDDTAEHKIIEQETTAKCKDLFSTLMESLTPQEALCFQLLNGIGTISGDPMTIRQIANSIETSVGTVHSFIDSAKRKIEETKKQHISTFESIFR